MWCCSCYPCHCSLLPIMVFSFQNYTTDRKLVLDAQEQQLFRRLCVFVGGSTLEAIEAICAPLNDGANQVLDGVASLIDKSLLQQKEQEDGQPRFLMLETIREYGLEALEAFGEVEAIQQAHGAYYLRLAEEAELGIRSPLQTAWLEHLEREHDNLRAALQRMLEHGEIEQSREMALRLLERCLSSGE